jgi:hypothetical protein
MSKVRWSVTADRLRKATQMIHAVSLGFGLDPVVKAKGAVIEALKGGFAEHFRPADPREAEQLKLDPGEPLCNMAGIYALIFSNDEIDVSDQRVQETIFALVERTVRECADTAGPGAGGGE